ncbi:MULTISPECIES: helix-turn-helix transcriptional regulator [Streptomyces]|uniref:Helix-turn-helix transcriptional regulator n=1 Tax=Streptomyces nigra TaxID=1827580 RepID=A0ABZ1ITH0_9ACTN|nr:helix-turn-helix transcriptional regulator [Streptomyces pilosus]
MTIFLPDPDFEALRLELARLRAARGWTYDELAARSGLARRTLIEIEQGRTIGTLKTWHALAHALSTPLDQLFGTLCGDHESPGQGGDSRSTQAT